MHVALVTHHYRPESGAPQRRWSALVQRFAGAGHRVSVLTPPPHYPSGVVAAEDREPHRPGTVEIGEWGETIYRVRYREHGPGLASRSLDQAVAASHSVVTALARLARRMDRPDVVIATAPGLPSLPAGRVIGAALRRPVVVEMRDAWPDLIGPSGMLGPDDRRSGLSRTLTRYAHHAITKTQRDAAAVVTTTQSFAEVLRSRGVRRVYVVRNGATLERLPVLDPPPLDPAARDGALRVLYLGTLGRSQGLSTVIDAARLARESGLRLDLRIGGSGADGPALRRHAEHTGTAVEFIGQVPRDRVAEQYAWADTAVVSLRSWQPFEWTIPSKLYEAMGMRRHVSGLLAGEAATIVKENRAGLVVAPESAQALAQAWVELAADRGQLDVGHEGRTWVMQHAHHDLLAARYLDILTEVTAR